MLPFKRLVSGGAKTAAPLLPLVGHTQQIGCKKMNKPAEKIRVPQSNNEIKAQVFMFNKPLINAFTPAWQPKTKQQLKEEFLEHIKSMMKDMERHKMYTLEEICGTEIWLQYEKSDRLSFGRYISSLVKKGELALESHKQDGENHNLYSLK